MGCGVVVGERGGRSGVVVRDVGTQRGSASARAMRAAGEELGRALSASVAEDMWAELFGVRVLRADDVHGREHGLLVQHDEVRWADVLAVAVFATPAIEALGHPRPGCAVDGSCGACEVVRALGRIRSIWRSSGLTLAEVGATSPRPDERTEPGWVEGGDSTARGR
jgi:hypothetical protein